MKRRPVTVHRGPGRCRHHGRLHYAIDLSGFICLVCAQEGGEPFGDGRAPSKAMAALMRKLGIEPDEEYGIEAEGTE